MKLGVPARYGIPLLTYGEVELHEGFLKLVGTN
jgi:hypothetical protein